MAKKRTQSEEAEQEKLVYGLMMDGLTTVQLVKVLSEQHGYEERNARRLIYKVNKSFKIQDEEEKEMLKDKYIEMYHHLYQEANADSDIKTANTVLNSIVKLQGLDVIKQEIKVEGTYTIEF